MIRKFINQVEIPELYGEELWNLTMELKFYLSENTSKIPFFFDRLGNRFFVFLIGGEVFYIGEMSLALSLGFSTYFLMYSVKRIWNDYNLNERISKILRLKQIAKKLKARERLRESRRRIRNLFPKMRAGSDKNLDDTIDLITDVVHYEPTRFNSVSKLVSNLTSFHSIWTLSRMQHYVASTLLKCFKPARYYRVVHPVLKSVIGDMMSNPQVNSAVRLISYEAFTLALCVMNNNVALPAILQGFSGGQHTIVSQIIKNAPIGGSIIYGAYAAFFVTNPLRAIPTVFIQMFGIFRASAYVRTYLFTRCEDFVLELPTTETYGFCPEEPKAIDTSYTREITTAPDDVIVSTDPKGHLYFQHDVVEGNPRVNIKTLDGRYRRFKIAGVAEHQFDWIENRGLCYPQSTSDVKKYIPLSQRTGTIADFKDFTQAVSNSDDPTVGTYTRIKSQVQGLRDVLRHDSTQNRNDMKAVLDHVQSTQLRDYVINDVLTE